MKVNTVVTSLLFLPVIAIAQEKEVQDMSDPLAVYTQAGAGYTDKGLNFKVGRAYDTGSDTTAAMHLIEVKGLLGDTLGWSDSFIVDNSIDSLRYRHFSVNLENGRGSQIDVNYFFDPNAISQEHGDASWSFIQALPKMGPVNIYPLAGVGVAFGKDNLKEDGSFDDGFGYQGGYGLIGLYGKVAITDKFWLNYNPFYVHTLFGDDVYKDNAYGIAESGTLLHEFVVSYQFTPTFNVRYFANWNSNLDIGDGDHRIEFNYQL
ncbi:hypothetical protein [Thalassotalea agarivorans]|uniref:Nucleoside-specific outer membrane channel protein Tsx n=1 Tax=Thalassotalea agarivorans TaxID=349064 RepID=A0A1I0BVS8_THASX|nr:hypothetical protein [Thalassotalea agarivorans]SET11206.1 hypothetical protein SAMN05660429_01072 [Thalassotalea agarivorans]